VPDAAVVVLSPELVQWQHPMRELQVLLERKAREPDSLLIIPVFIGLTVEQCDDLEGLYHSQPWPLEVSQPSEQQRADSLDEWAAAIEQLRLQPTVVNSEEVGGAYVKRDVGSCRVLVWCGAGARQHYVSTLDQQSKSMRPAATSQQA
jgi:hypothetical protein